MKEKMRVMTAKPLNAETPNDYLRSWITPNDVFFDRNQGAIPTTRISLATNRPSPPLGFSMNSVDAAPGASAT